MGGFNFNLPGINFNPQMLQNIQQEAAMAAPPDIAAPVDDGFPSFEPVFTGMAAMQLTGERDFDSMILGERDQQSSRQFQQFINEQKAAGNPKYQNYIYGLPGGKPGVMKVGINAEGTKGPNYQEIPYSTPGEYIDAYNIMLNTPAPPESWRNQKSGFGKFVDEKLGGPAGLFGLTVGALTGGLGYAGMLGSAGAGAAAGAGTAALTGGNPLQAGLAGAGGGLIGGGANALLAGAPSAGAGSAGLSGISAPTAAGGGTSAINLGAAGLGAAAPAVSTTAPLTMGGLVGGVSPAAGGINLGAAGLGAAGAAAGTAAPLTMGGLLGGTSPAAGSINLGAAGLGTAAAGGAGTMGGISGFLNSASNFLGSPGGRLLSTLGEAGLSYLGGQDQMDLARELAAQSQFRPYNIQGPLGNVDIQGQQINISPTQQQAALQQQLFGLSSGALGRAQDPALMNIFAGVPGQVSNLTQQFIGQETGIPGAARTLEQQLSGIGTESLGMGRGFLGQAGALPSAAGAITPFVGGPGPTSPGEALVSQAAGASLGLLGEGTAGARDISGTLAGAGGELLRGATAGAPSFNQLATERLTALREAARPEEERTTQAALERLFSQGRLGTTGGARVLGELSRAQELADIQRVTSAQDFAQNQQNVALENALRRGELGLSALGGAMGGSQFLAGAGANLLGLGAETGLQGRTLEQRAREANLNAILGGVSTDIEAALGQGRLGTQLYGLGAGMPATIFDAQRLADEAALNRGAQRIAAAEGLFGFGQNARTSELGMGLDVMNAQRMQFDPLIQLTNIASGMGGAQSLAAARGAQGVMGSFASPYDYGAGIFGRYAG